MIPFNENNTIFKGTVDIESNTVIPVFTTNKSTLADGCFQFGDSETIAIQMFSDDISDSLAYTVQWSLDKTNWATATDSAGDDVTGTLVVDVASIIPLRGVGNLWVRVSLTVTSETGTVSYLIKEGK